MLGRGGEPRWVPWGCNRLVEGWCAQGAVALVGSQLVKSGKIKVRFVYTG